MLSAGRRACAVVLLVGSLGVAGCGHEDPGAAQESTSEAPTPSQTPSTYTPPELDRTALDANLAALTQEDRSLVDHYTDGHRSGAFDEGTWIVAAPLTVAGARERLLGPGAQPASEAELRRMRFDESAYAFLQVGDGVVAWEDTGFADPPARVLAALSEGGGVSAVATDNVEAMTRFGYARDGEVVFDAVEYAFVDSLDEIPPEVRDLARLAWSDPSGPLVETAGWAAVAQAMSEKVTGVRAAPAVRDVEDRYAVQVPWAGLEDE